MRATVDEDIAQQRVTDDAGAFGSSVTGEQIAQPAQGIDCDRYSRQLGRDGPMDNGLHREVVHRTELLFAINPRQSCQRVEFLHRVQASSFHRPWVVPKAHLLPPADVATWRAYEHYFSPGFSEATGHVQPEVVEHQSQCPSSLIRGIMLPRSARRNVAVSRSGADPFREANDTGLVLRRRIEPLKALPGFVSHLRRQGRI